MTHASIWWCSNKSRRKKKILKVGWGRGGEFKVSGIKIAWGASTAKLEGGRQSSNVFKILKEKDFQPKILDPVKTIPQEWGCDKAILGIQRALKCYLPSTLPQEATGECASSEQGSKLRKRKTVAPRKRKGQREFLTIGNGNSEGDRCATGLVSNTSRQKQKDGMPQDNVSTENQNWTDKIMWQMWPYAKLYWEDIS